jgi:hypothetical protein
MGADPNLGHCHDPTITTNKGTGVVEAKILEAKYLLQPHFYLSVEAKIANSNMVSIAPIEYEDMYWRCHHGTHSESVYNRHT